MYNLAWASEKSSHNIGGKDPPVQKYPDLEEMEKTDNKDLLNKV